MKPAELTSIAYTVSASEVDRGGPQVLGPRTYHAAGSVDIRMSLFLTNLFIIVVYAANLAAVVSLELPLYDSGCK